MHLHRKLEERVNKDVLNDLYKIRDDTMFEMEMYLSQTPSSSQSGSLSSVRVRIIQNQSTTAHGNQQTVTQDKGLRTQDTRLSNEILVILVNGICL